MSRASALWASVLSLGLLLPPGALRAATDEAPLSAAARPKVKLDRLTFPASFNDAKDYESHLRGTLKREARRADWGAGSGSKISYRFFVEELELREDGGVLHVTCTALGRLPKGKSAKSHIVFGGDLRERKKVVEHVLDIVARGVVTRLAELERARRTP
ncbi:MAG TPA: hypothetical protein VHV51_04600 [Polyangiaceae bacterium]|nr:hypothetical protein [Polyangiaceae bacterium]